MNTKKLRKIIEIVTDAAIQTAKQDALLNNASFPFVYPQDIVGDTELEDLYAGVYMEAYTEKLLDMAP